MKESSEKIFDEKIYKALLDTVEKLPKEAIETAKKEITRKGYDTTGYQYQFLVNVINEVIGVPNWSYDYKILRETEGQWNNGRPFFEITIEFSLTILDITRKNVGGHKAEMYADALKGAITNAFKKTAAMFGVGKKAYEGTIDEDYRPIPIPNGSVKSSINTPIKSHKQLEDEIKQNEFIGQLYTCTQCESVIDQKVNDYSIKFHKKALCRDCQNKEKQMEFYAPMPFNQ